MTKTLTEQWRDGTIPDDTYYWKVCKENWIADKYEMYDYTKVCDVNKIECLEPVPSYDEWKKLDDELKEIATKNDTICMENGRLQERLDIATKALKKIAFHYAPEYNFGGKISHKALKEMDGVK